MAGAMRQRFVDVTTGLLERDQRLMLLLADLSAEMFQQAIFRHPTRAINFGIREQLMIDAAGGMALAGMRPIVHSFAPFLIERPFEQIKISLNHQGAGAMLVSAGASYDISSGGRTHQSPGDVALLGTLADWTVHVPGHEDEAEHLIRAGAARDGLVYVRLSNQSNTLPLAPSGESLVVLRRGTLGVVIAVGPMADVVIAATEGMDITLLYTPTPRPLDAAALRTFVAGQSAAPVAVVEPLLEGTSAEEVRAAMGPTFTRLLMVGVPRPELRNYGSAAQHARAHGLDPMSLRRRLISFFEHP